MINKLIALSNKLDDSGLQLVADEVDELIKNAIDNDNIDIEKILVERKQKAEQGDWFPAAGGTETPFVTRNRRRLLYVWQPTTGKHAYLDCDTDLILSDEEASNALGL